MKIKPFYWTAKPGEESTLEYLGLGFLWDGDSLDIEICLFLICFGIKIEKGGNHVQGRA